MILLEIKVVQFLMIFIEVMDVLSVEIFFIYFNCDLKDMQLNDRVISRCVEFVKLKIVLKLSFLKKQGKRI